MNRESVTVSTLYSSVPVVPLPESCLVIGGVGHEIPHVLHTNICVFLGLEKESCKQDLSQEEMLGGTLLEASTRC